VYKRQIYSALQLGTIDAFEMGGYGANWELGFQEVCPYIIEPAFHCTTGSPAYIANLDAWNSLPSDLQAIVTTASFNSGINFWLQTKKSDLEARQKWIDYGCEVLTLPDEDLEEIYEVAEDVWKEFSETNEDAARLYEAFKKNVELHGYSMD